MSVIPERKLALSVSRELAAASPGEGASQGGLMAKLSGQRYSRGNLLQTPGMRSAHPYSKDLNVGGRSTLASRADKVGSSCPTWTESQLRANERGG